ncbi:MAG: ABC transporter permease [Gemmatimonadaceae bacterium]|nr:ABC transporter permease [Gemmatimonadaceae bacterium]
MSRALRALLRKEFLQIRRDPVILRMLLVMPVLQLLVLANAATFEVKRSLLWVIDQDRTPASQGLIERFRGSGRFVIAGSSPTAGPADAALLRGDADVALTIPAGFASDLTRARRATVQLSFDAVNGSQAGITQGYSAEIIAAYADELAEASPRAIPTVRRQPPTIEIQRRGWYNASLDYRFFMVPGILVQLVTMVGTLMTALNIVREKEAGTLDQLNVTPIRPSVFIAAKLLPLWIIGLFEFCLGMVIARVVFGVPFEGTPVLLLVGAAIYLLGALGVGLWISTITETQQQALFVTFALLMVYILMSGLFTPVRGMPDWVRVIAQVNPLLHFIGMTRAVMLRGAQLLDVLPQLGALSVIGTVILTAAVRRYRKVAA